MSTFSSGTSVPKTKVLFSHLGWSTLLALMILLFYILENQAVVENLQNASICICISSGISTLLFFLVNTEKRSIKQTLYFGLVTGVLVGIVVFWIMIGREVGRMFFVCSHFIPIMTVMHHYVFRENVRE